MSSGRGFSKRIGDTLWLHFEGRTYTVDLNDPTSANPQGERTSARAKGQQAHSGLLKSPMPGKILKINFKSGDAVAAGQTVCVIEAMKMEYALKAPFTGIIKDIIKKPGDGVTLDEKIAQISKADPELKGGDIK